MEKTLTIDKKQADFIDSLLNMTGDEIYQKHGLKRDEIISNIVKFDDGTEVDIKLVICEGNATPYTEAVLFQNGSEITCSECEESYFGDWILNANGIEYNVVIKREDEFEAYKLHSIIAMESEGMETRVIAIVLRIIDENIDIKEAVRAACTEYVQTKAGFNTYEYNCNYFDWADFEMNVPNYICRRHGFEKVDSIMALDDVAWGEQLVDEDKLRLTDEQFEALKSELFNHGTEAIEDFLGTEVPEDWEKDTIDNMMDEIADQMPDIEQLRFYQKYVN